MEDGPPHARRHQPRGNNLDRKPDRFCRRPTRVTPAEPPKPAPLRTRGRRQLGALGSQRGCETHDQKRGANASGFYCALRLSLSQPSRRVSEAGETRPVSEVRWLRASAGPRRRARPHRAKRSKLDDVVVGRLREIAVRANCGRLIDCLWPAWSVETVRRKLASPR